MNFKGSLPLLILHLLSRRPAHGYRIAKEIKHRSEGVLDFAEGTLYPTLHNMEKQGLIEAFEEEEKGRTRRYYRLTETGRQALARERGEWERYTRVVNLILEDAS
jgi:PadR family transcriptional regulator PadR